MAKHSAVDVGQAWVRNGGNPAKVIEAVAITWAESKWDDNASSYCCHGVWALHEEHTQITCARNLDCATKRAITLSNNGQDWSPWDVHPDSSGRTGFGSSSIAIRNYRQGLRIARRQLRRSGRQFISAELGPDVEKELREEGYSQKEIEEASGAPIEGLVEKIPGLSEAEDAIGGVIGDALKPIVDISAFFVGLGELLLTPEGWLRLAKLGGGSIFILWGLRIIVKDATGSDPVGVAKKAATTAAEIAVVKKV